MRVHLVCHLVAGLVLLVSAPLVFAAGSAVDTRTAGNQQTPDVARAASGASVIVWSGPADQRNLSEVFARRYDARGNPLGPPIQVNQSTALRQYQPGVAMAADGSFAVVWSNGEDGPGFKVAGRRFDASGNPLGPEFRIDTDSSVVLATAPDIAMNASGDAVVVWGTRKTIGGLADLDARTIRGRTLSASGELGRTFRTAFNFLPLLLAPRAGIAPNGDFAIVYRSDGSEKITTGIYIRRYRANGRPYGFLPRRADRRLAAVDAPNAPRIAFGPDGGYAVAWTGYRRDSTPVSVFTRRFSADGRALNDPRQIGAGLRQPSIAIDTAGNLLLATSKANIELRRITRDGNIGTPQTIEGSRAYRVLAPSVAVDNAGRALIAWQDYGRDGDGRGVFARTVTTR